MQIIIILVITKINIKPLITLVITRKEHTLQMLALQIWQIPKVTTHRLTEALMLA